MTFADRNPFRVAAICHVLVAAPLFGAVTVHLAAPAGPVAAGTDVLLRPEVTGAGAATGVDWAVAEDFKLVDEAAGVTLRPHGEGVWLFRASAGTRRTFQVRATSQADPHAFTCIEIEVAPRAGAGESKAAGAAAREVPDLAPGTSNPAWEAIRQDPGTPWLWETPFGQRRKVRRLLGGFALDPRAAVPTVVAVEGFGSGRVRVVRIDITGKVTPVADPLVVPKGAPPLDRIGGVAVAFAPDGDVLLAPIRYERILRVAPDGTTSVLADAEGPIEVGNPGGVAVTQEGDVVYSDSDTCRVYRVDHATRRREVLAGTDPADRARPGIRNDLGLARPAAHTTFYRPSEVAATPDGRILVSDRLGVLAIHRDGTLRRITPPGIYPMHIAAGPDNRVYFSDWHDGGKSICRVDPGGVITRLNRMVDTMEGSGERFRLVASSRGISHISSFQVLPGGAILFNHDLDRLTLMGPAPSDASLAKLVHDGARAALEGRWKRAGEIRDSLRRRAEADPEARTLLETASSKAGQDLPKALAQPLVRKIGEYTGADPKGLSFRAWVALYVLDREVRDHSPELADRLAAFPRRARAAATGAGATETKAGAGESKAGAVEPKIPAGESKETR